MPATTLDVAAPAFMEMAHRIVWCSAATVDPSGRPRSRVLHPIWEWDGSSLVGWVGTSRTPAKDAHLAHSPYLSCTYWSPSQDTCTAECHATWVTDPDERLAVWDRLAGGPEPVGYDPSMIPGWSRDPDSSFTGLRLEPWRLRLMDGVMMATGGAEGRLLTWRAGT
ncbi:MAG: pyridoxamine 5'-phosphate oxidase family protein [Actinomycetota bacterium]|nr:pyridoxamine 5'-phosphate oxidase family protein [Actinomycetota bacterium]